MSGGAPLPHSHFPLCKVQEVQFEIFKEKQIKDYAVCCVTQAKSYEGGEPVREGINDLRMGSTDFDHKCETCGLQHPDCPGHFGYVELAEPLFNNGVFDMLLLVLKCVCKSCGELLVDASNDAVRDACNRLTGVLRLRMVAKLSGRKCKEDSGSGCGEVQPNVGRFQGIYPGLQVRATQADQDQVWYANKVYEIVNMVSDSAAEFMGFQPSYCHPRDLLLTVLPVPPPQVRPAVAFGSAKSDDELTHQILAIIKRNNQLRSDINAGEQAGITRSRSLLQESVSALFNNAATYYRPVKVNDTKRLKSLTERLKGKYGRLRGNLMGKRVDFSARTVITGDPNIDVDEVGVPFSVAMTLTFPERVNAINKKRLTECVRRTTYPSANYIFRPNGSIIKLRLAKDREKINLSIGDVVERHIINGDVVLFNRQPTLHRMSMMGHRVRVLSYNTFRLNLSCTTPYNADFDGDEMNLHVPQSLLTKAELIEMMMVPKNFVSPNKSAPCMGIVQDSLLGSYRLTDRDTFLDKYFVQSVALWLDLWELPIPAILVPEPLWTGKQIFSLVLPEVNHGVTVDRTKVPFPHNDKDVVIERGQLLVGQIKKGVIGAAPGSLIHVIFNERGSDEVAKFINGVQRITAFFLLNFAFSVGVQDTVADTDTLSQMNVVLQRTREEVEEIGAAANNRKLTRKAGMTLLQSFEADVNSALNKCREQAAQRALDNVRRTNSFKVMIEAGSKGSDLNICQIAVFVGQQNVAGSRIPFGFRRRTLPHFMLDDYGETSRGMANRGYVEGLKPHEFYFHTMAGREGLIDTAVKTSDTGYLQRKLIKALEDVHASYDGTVRNADQELIQLIYGEDGLDGARIEGNQVLPLPHLDDKEMADMYQYEYGEDGRFTSEVGGTYMDPTVKRMLERYPDNVMELQAEYDTLLEDRKTARKILDMQEKKKMKMNLPVNVDRLILNARTTMGKRSQVSNLNPINVIKSVRELQEKLMRLFPTYHRDPSGNIVNSLAQQRIERALTLFNIHLRQTLGSKRVLQEYKLSDRAFEYLIKEIRTKYQQALVTPGEIIGVIAAQSCGEPATQMTLNTFHNAGISSKNVTLGVPRLLELLNVSKNQRNASLAVMLAPEWSKKEKALKAQHMIEYCTLASITSTIQIIYDPDPLNTVVEEDMDILRAEDQVKIDDDEAPEGQSPFIARLILDGTVFADKDLNMTQVKAAIRQVTEEYIIQANMENNAVKRIIRLRPVSYAAADSVPKLINDIPILLAQVHLHGIPGVQKALLKATQVFNEVESDPHTQQRNAGGLVPSNVWMIDTEGTALRQIFVGVLDKNDNNIVDFSKTSSNKVPEVAKVLGIEAARRKLLNELREAYMAYGLNINYRHYSILVDTMCQRGYLMAVSRTGINRSAMSGPLMRCSFEETVKVLMAAAAFGECDPVKGVSANLILGNQARAGTGLFDVILNMSLLQRAVAQEVAVAPGKNVNVYHGPDSVLDVASVAPAFKGVDATPLVNAGSELDAGASSMAPVTGQSMLYGASVDVSMVHPSQLYVNNAFGEPSSKFHSLQSSASVYQPLQSSMLPENVSASSSSLPSEGYEMPSSYHLHSDSVPLESAVLGDGHSNTATDAPFSASYFSFTGGKAPVPAPDGSTSHASVPYYGYSSNIPQPSTAPRFSQMADGEEEEPQQ